MRHIVIIGNGISGITAARDIRKGSADPITVISSETDHFFSRTALMYIYMGHMQYAHTKPYEDWFWKKNRIDLMRAHVEQLDTQAQTLRLSTQQTVSYTTLILALGSSPNFYNWPGQDLTGVQGLYGMPDLECMEASTKNIRQAVVVGGGLIGIEMAEMLLSRQIQVTFLVREKSFWRSVLPPEESAMITRHIREHHVDLRVESELKELVDDGTGRVKAVITTQGETIPAQFVGITVGVSPSISLLANTAIEVDRGVLVNPYLETSIPGIYAIGDCVQHRTPPPGRKAVEQIWYTGRLMGETVAKTILGQPTAYEPGVFFNSAKFFDIEYQTYGDVPASLPQDGSIQTFYWQHPDQHKAIRINFRTDASLAVTGMNTFGIRQRQAVWSRWIQEGSSIGQVITNLTDANFDPEFFQRHEADITAKFNSDFPDLAVGLKPKKRGWWQGLMG